MLRIASACTSDSLNRFISTGFGSSSVADDADHLVEVEVGDEVAFEHLEPVADLVEAEFRAPHQHLAPMREPLVEHLAEAHHLAARDPATGR